MCPTINDASEGATTTQTLPETLREVAAWLEAHPEVKVTYAFVPVDALERADLERLATDLGDRATERLGYGDMVTIEGHFGDPHGGVRVYGNVLVKHLTVELAPPKYRPIIPVASDGES